MKQLSAYLIVTIVLCAIQIEVFSQITDIDGHIYKTAKIGSQIWMIENLNVSHFRNGEPIPEITETGGEKGWKFAARMGKPGWFFNHADTNNFNKYGKIYNGFAVADARGLAPVGWHVATDAEWATLIDYLGGANSAGTKMKTTSAWDSSGNGNNQSSFSGLPGGFRAGDDGSSDPIGIEGMWWSSTEATMYNFRWCYTLLYSNSSIERSNHKNGSGMSVRCVKD